MLGSWVESLFNQPVLRPAPENLLESVENGWLARLGGEPPGSTCPKAVSTLVSEFLELPLHPPPSVVLTQPYITATEETLPAAPAPHAPGG